MKKSTKIAVGGTFMILAIFSAGALFQSLGLSFGLAQFAGATVAGLVGAFRLTQ